MFSVEKKLSLLATENCFEDKVCAFTGSLVFIKKYFKSFGGKMFALEKKVCASQ